MQQWEKNTFLGCLAMSGNSELTLKELLCIKTGTSTVRGKSLGTAAQWESVLLLLKVSHLTPCMNKLYKVQSTGESWWTLKRHCCVCMLHNCGIRDRIRWMGLMGGIGLTLCDNNETIQVKSVTMDSLDGFKSDLTHVICCVLLICPIAAWCTSNVAQVQRNNP